MTNAPDRPDLEDAVDQAAIVGATRDRIHAARATPDRRSGLVTGGSFLVLVGAWLILAPPAGASVVAFVTCVFAHAVASSVEFEIGPGSAIPTMPVLVITLFLLPPQLAPVVAAGGLLLAATVARLRDPSRRERFLVLAGSGWHAVGPAAVFAVFGVARADPADLAIYALALGAQFVFDAGSSWVRNCYGLGVSTSQLAGALRFTFLADLLLAPIGFAAALAVPGSPAAVLFLIPPTLLLAMLQRDRLQHISRTVVLGEAVAETADRARRDILTGLRNRLAWEEALLAHADSPVRYGVVLADVDGLKAANDAYGHDVGDRLLAAVAAIISRVTPDGALAARLGGDEFGILLQGDQADRADGIADSLRAALAGAVPLDDRVPISASVGAGLAADGAALAEAFIDADRAVYDDKGRPGILRRSPGLGLAAERLRAV